MNARQEIRGSALTTVRAAFENLLPVSPHIEPRLRGALAQTLETPGSLARAELAYGLMTCQGVGDEPALRVATAIEYFHTASLLFDDLPCMDDALERRGSACPHLVWGEASAVLAALALIAQGYALLWRAIGDLSPRRRKQAADLVLDCVGLDGVLNGQALDLSFDQSDRSPEAVRRVAEGKTVTMIRLALLLPSLVAGMPHRELVRLERLAAAWGHAYQALDDFKDVLLASTETGKTTTRDESLGRPNLVRSLDRRAALRELDGRLAEARAIVASFDAHRISAVLLVIAAKLDNERQRIAQRLGAEPNTGPGDRGVHEGEWRARDAAIAGAVGH